MLGWEETYLTFFEWFDRERIPSFYYSRYAVFLSGLLGHEKAPEKRKRIPLLSRNLVNLDLIPYHSRRISLHIKTEEQRKMITPYVQVLGALVKLCKPKALFMNGAVFKPILGEVGFSEKSMIKVNKRLKAHLGECYETRAIWFDKFLSGKSAGATNKELFDAGKKVKSRLKL